MYHRSISGPKQVGVALYVSAPWLLPTRTGVSQKAYIYKWTPVVSFIDSQEKLLARIC